MKLRIGHAFARHLACALKMLIIVSMSLILSTHSVDAQGLQVTYNAHGIGTLSYNGVQLLDANAHPEDAFNVYGYVRVRPDGSVEDKKSWDNGYTVSWDLASKLVIWTYDWGVVRCRYVQQGDKLNLRMAVVNKTTSDVIKGVDIFPLSVRFPSMPNGWDANTPHSEFNLNGPSVIVANFGNSSMALCNEDTSQKLYTGFLTLSPDTQNSNRFPLWVGSTPLWFQPPGYPVFSRPIGPGKTDVYVMSLRFGPAGISAKSIASDLYQKSGHVTSVADYQIPTAGDTTGSGSGLKAEYFNDPDGGATSFGNKALSRVDSTVNFDWGAGSPDPTVHTDYFSVRWVGKVLPRYSENYEFHVTSDDGCRLWVDDKLVIDSWGGHSPQDDMGPMALNAGQKYNLKLEYRELQGGASVKLEWLSEHEPKAVIPSSQLFPRQ
jgi:hypothetical protein